MIHQMRLGVVVVALGTFPMQDLLRLTFPRAKLRRQILMTRAEVWAKNWAKNWANFSAHFRASFAVQNDPQIFSQNSSQFITPCLVAENMKFHLRELLGFGGRKTLRTLTSSNKDQKFKCFNHVHVQKRGFTKFSVSLKQVSLLNPRVRMNFVAFPLERARKEPRSSVRFWAATGVW